MSEIEVPRAAERRQGIVLTPQMFKLAVKHNESGCRVIFNERTLGRKKNIYYVV
jgi:hypothetical protein